jgi:hypothetical protein
MGVRCSSGRVYNMVRADVGCADPRRAVTRSIITGLAVTVRAPHSPRLSTILCCRLFFFFTSTTTRNLSRGISLLRIFYATIGFVLIRHRRRRLFIFIFSPSQRVSYTYINIHTQLCMKYKRYSSTIDGAHQKCNRIFRALRC